MKSSTFHDATVHGETQYSNIPKTTRSVVALDFKVRYFLSNDRELATSNN